MTIVDDPKPTPGTAGRPALLCILVGHEYDVFGVCERPGCQTVTVSAP